MRWTRPHFCHPHFFSSFSLSLLELSMEPRVNLVSRNQPPVSNQRKPTAEEEIACSCSGGRVRHPSSPIFPLETSSVVVNSVSTFLPTDS